MAKHLDSDDAGRTSVRPPARPATASWRAACFAAWLLAGAATASAQPASSAVPQGPVNYIFSAGMPPGTVGAARLQRRGAVHGYYQPVVFSGPSGVRFSLVEGGTFHPDADGPLHAGLLVGAVYRFKITGIPYAEGHELYPTVEVIDRVYPPPGQAARFAIPVTLELSDLQEALAGRLVTRVIYLEDPQTALPVAETPETARSFDVRLDQDALQVADALGRPVAIVRIGSLLPPHEPGLLPQFFFGSPAWHPIATPRTEPLGPPDQPVAIRTPHIPRDDVPRAAFPPAGYPPAAAAVPHVAHPHQVNPKPHEWLR